MQHWQGRNHYRFVRTPVGNFLCQPGIRGSIEGGILPDAINEGVRAGYREGCLRKSIVKDPFERVNTGDNTPALIHLDVVNGDSTVTLFPKAAVQKT